MVSQLKALWQTVFGDGPDWLDPWFDAFYQPEHTAALWEGSRLLAAAYLLPVGSFQGSPCCHLYAVAVHPDYRGLGLGLAVTRRAVEKAQAAGFAHILLHPADRGLFSFYEKCGFVAGFPVEEEVLEPSKGRSILAPCSVDDYLTQRKELLAHRPAIAHDRALLDFFTASGGRLYRGEGWCAALEEVNGEARFLEWIGPAPSPDLLSAMAPEASRFLVRRPIEDGEAGQPFAMRYGKTEDMAVFWPGLALD